MKLSQKYETKLRMRTTGLLMEYFNMYGQGTFIPQVAMGIVEIVKQLLKEQTGEEANR